MKKGTTKQVVLGFAAVIGALVFTVSVIFGYWLLEKNQQLTSTSAQSTGTNGTEQESEESIYDRTIPDQIRAVWVHPGTDSFLQADEASVAAEAEKLVTDMETYQMNTLFVDVLKNGKALYGSDLLKTEGADVLAALCEKAETKGIRVYAALPISVLLASDDTQYEVPGIESPKLLEDVSIELVQNYPLSGVMITENTIKKTGALYQAYMNAGSAASFEDWARSVSAGTGVRAAQAIRQANPSLPIGLSVSAVYRREDGAKVPFASFDDGYFDSLKAAQSGEYDFLNVSVPYALDDSAVPFAKAVSWWAAVCREQELPMVVTHAGEKACAPNGFSGTDELARQVSTALKSGYYYGSVFTGFSHLLTDPNGAFSLLMKYYQNEYAEDELFKDLTVTLPAQKNTVTYEDSVQFRGKFDSTQEVKLNGEVIESSEKGGFSEWVDLKVGKNEIKLEHKGKTVVYTVERRVKIIDNVTPSQNMTVVGGTTLEIGAMAYKGASVSATLNGKTIRLTETDGGVADTADALYVYYSGSFTCPQSTSVNQKLGSVSVHASYAGMSESKRGGSITVSKTDEPSSGGDSDGDGSGGSSSGGSSSGGDGSSGGSSGGGEGSGGQGGGAVLQHAIVKNAYAEKYPYLSTAKYPEGVLFPLPKNTRDVIQSKNGSYLNLRSGATIKSSDVTIQNLAFGGNNTIKSLKAGVEGTDTVFRIGLDWNAPFSIALSPGPAVDEDEIGASYQFAASTVTITLDYASELQAENVAMNLSSSPIFSGAKTQRIYDSKFKMYRYQIILTMRKTGKYYGCYAEYSGNTLVLRFNHGATSNLSGVKICIDPGHGGNDPGNTAGKDVLEKSVALLQAQAIADELRARGATVVMTRTGDQSLSLEQRVQFGNASNCDLFISVHYNSAGKDAKPYGAQTYYNTPFSQPLAKAVQSEIEGVVPSSKWNKYAHYNFYVTRSKQRPGILIECGFLSNPSDEKLAQSAAQRQKFAKAVAQGVANYYSAYR